MRRRKTKGKEIRKGSFVAKIYKAKRTIGGRVYQYYRISYVEPGGRRVVRDFGEESAAEKAVAEASKAFALGRPDALSFRPEEQQEYDAAYKLLRGTGASVYQAAQALVAAKAIPKSTRTPRMVKELVEDFLTDRKTAGVSETHLKDLRSRLGKFAKAFSCDIGTISPGLVEQFLNHLRNEDGTPQTAVSRRNMLRIVSALFHFARRRGHAERELAEAVSEISAPKITPSETGIFTPDEMQKILAAARTDLVAAFAIGAFAGLRSEEIKRLDWSDIRLEEGVIIVKAAVAKTASRRVVPIQPNLANWLRPLRSEAGPVVPKSDGGQVLQNAMRLTAAKAGLVWVRNGLRHSFCSYRLATTHDAARVAAEAGNSPGMVHKHYKSLVTESLGLEWFSINPPSQ